MTLFELLSERCTIEFPSGYVLVGDPEFEYIDTYVKLAGELKHDGLRNLSKEGTRLALMDARNHAELNKES